MCIHRYVFCIVAAHIVGMHVLVYTGLYLLGEAGGKLPPQQPSFSPKWFAYDSTHQIRIAILMPALITQELKFSLFKLNPIINKNAPVFVLHVGGGTSPSNTHPLKLNCQRQLPSPPPPPQILNPR